MSQSPNEKSIGGFSLVNLGDFGKAVNTLVERASDAIGGLARPWQIKRVAKAEAGFLEFVVQRWQREGFKVEVLGAAQQNSTA